MVVSVLGCSRDGNTEAGKRKAERPASARVPDVIGMSEQEALSTLEEALGPDRVGVFSTSRHGTVSFEDVSGVLTTTAEVTTITPAPGEPAGKQVWMRVGPIPEGDIKGIKLGVGWFDHPRVAQAEGADVCLKSCHEQKECTNCHLIVKRGAAARGGVATDIEKLAEEIFGKGSMSEPGSRGLLLKGKNVYVAEVTLDPSWDAARAEEETRERTEQFVNGALAKADREQLAWLQVAWFKPDSSLRLMEETYENTPDRGRVKADDLFPGVAFEKFTSP
jgi:hypothetical protein